MMSVDANFADRCFSLICCRIIELKKGIIFNLYIYIWTWIFLAFSTLFLPKYGRDAFKDICRFVRMTIAATKMTMVMTTTKGMIMKTTTTEEIDGLDLEVCIGRAGCARWPEERKKKKNGRGKRKENFSLIIFGSGCTCTELVEDEV